MMIDKNELIQQFSAPMGNTEKNFVEFAQANRIDDYPQLIEEFQAIQNQVYDFIYQMTEPDVQLSSQEITGICREFCRLKVDWINEAGIDAVINWLLWMCWHEGILKQEKR